MIRTAPRHLGMGRGRRSGVTDRVGDRHNYVVAFLKFSCVSPLSTGARAAVVRNVVGPLCDRPNFVEACLFPHLSCVCV